MKSSATKVTCDRCKKSTFFEKTGWEEEDRAARSMWAAPTAHAWSKVSYNNGSRSKTLDLCEDCTQSFNLWLESTQ